MTAQVFLLQGLITSLDDARVFHCSIARKVTRTYLQRSLERIIQTHMIVATDLVDHIERIGGRVKRCGSHLAPWRALQAEWRARLSLDIETEYAAQAEKYEVRVLRHFRSARARTRDPGMRDRLMCHGRKIERACADIGHHGLVMQMQATPLTVRVNRAS